MDIDHERIILRCVIALKLCYDDALLLFHFLNECLAGDLSEVNNFASPLQLCLSGQQQHSNRQAGSHQFHFGNV
jgi:hypothetical protein